MMSIHLLYPSAKSRWLSSVMSGQAPDHPLYGFTHYEKYNLLASFSDKGFNAPFLKLLFVLLQKLFLWQTYMGFKLHVVLAQLRQMRHANLLVCFAENVGLPALLLRKLKLISAPIIFVSIGFDQRFLRRASLMKRFIRNLLAEADRIVVYSRKERDVYHESFGVPLHKLHVVALGVDIKFLSPQKSEEAIDVLAAGRDYGRDFVTLIKALRGTSHKAALICPREHIKGTLLPENVVHYEQVDYKRMRDLYSKAKIVVVSAHPYKTSGQFGVLEAWAMGKAVIASNVSRITTAFSAVDGTHYRLVPPGNARKLRTAIAALHADAWLRKRYGRAGRNLVVRKHSSASYSKALASVIQEVIDEQE